MSEAMIGRVGRARPKADGNGALYAGEESRMGSWKNAQVIGAVALLALGTTAVRGQETRTTTGTDPGQARAAGQADVANHMLIVHALAMSIEGSTLQAQAGGGEGHGSAAQLRQHARQAFEASDKLFREAGRDVAAKGVAPVQPGQGNRNNELTGSPIDRFYTAANEYASTLRRVGDQGGDMASVALINHALHEVLDAHHLRHATSSAGMDSTAGRMLLEHARQMDHEGRRVLETFASARNADAGAAKPGQDQGGAARPASVRTLVHQAREIVRALDDLGHGGHAGAAAPPTGRPQ
jgi:hypothetical protein